MGRRYRANRLQGKQSTNEAQFLTAARNMHKMHIDLLIVITHILGPMPLYRSRNWFVLPNESVLHDVLHRAISCRGPYQTP